MKRRMTNTDIDSLIGVKNKISDTSIITGLWISCVIGGCIMVIFCILQRISVLYRYRLIAKNVRVKPPRLAKHGVRSLFDWAAKAITIPDIDLVQSAGLDALVMVKLCALGVQMFLPMCILGVGILIPLHWHGGESRTTDAYQSTFMRLTMSNLPAGSPKFWIHFVFVYIYMGWAMVLLRWHYHQYLTIRQHYLRKGDDVNLWRTLYDEQPNGLPRDNITDIRTFLRALPLLKALLPTGVPVDDAVEEHGVEPVKDSDEEDEPHLQSPRPAPRPLTATSSARFTGEVRQRGMAHSSSARVRSLRISSVTEGNATLLRNVSGRNDAGPMPGGPPSGRTSSQPQLLGKSRLSGSGAPDSGPQRSALVNDGMVTGGAGSCAEQHGGRFLRSQVKVHAGDGHSHGKPHGRTHLRPAPKLPTLGSEELAAVVDDSARIRSQGGQTGSHHASSAHSNGTRGSPGLSWGGAGPIAEAIECLPDDVTDPSASGGGAAGAAGAAAAVGSSHPARSSEVARKSPSPIRSPFTAPGPVRCPSSTDYAGTGVRLPDPDLEAGQPQLSTVISAPVIAAPAAISSMSRSDAIDREAHRVEWWADFGRLRFGGVHDADQEFPPAESARGGNAAGLGTDAQALSLSRPSVGHRKTVNAVCRDGTRVAVLAQHYAVLVTDVVERKQVENSTSINKGQARSETGVPTTQPAASGLVRFVPLAVRRWCNMRYGNEAARKLNLTVTSIGSSYGSEAGTEFKIPQFGSQTPSIGAHSRISYAPSLSSFNPALQLDLSLRPTCSNRPRPGHRRTFSTGDQGQPGPGRQGPARQLSGMSSLAAAMSVVSTTATDPARPSCSQTGSRSRHTSLRQGSADGPRGSSATQFMHMLGMLTQQAVAAKEILSGGHNAGLSPAETQLQPQQLPSARASQDGNAASGSCAAAGDAQGHIRVDSGQPPKDKRRRSLINLLVTSGGAGGEAKEPGKDLDIPDVQQHGALPPVTSIELGPSQPDGVRRRAGPLAEAAEDDRYPAIPDGVASLDGAAGPGGSGVVVNVTTAYPIVPAMAMLDTDEVRGSGGAAVPEERPSGDTCDGSGVAGGGGASQPGGGSKWDLVREAVWDRRVAALPSKTRYSIVSATFSRLFPEEFDRAIPVIKHKEVDMLLMQVEQHMSSYEYAKKYEDVNKEPLFGRIGACGLFGERRRLKEYHMEQVNRLMAEVKNARRRAFDEGHTPSYFVFFRTQRAAAIASQCVIHAEDNRQFRVHPAPGPEEVNWPALWSNYASRDLRKTLMRPILFLVIIFPIGIFTGALMQLDYLLCPEHICTRLDKDSDEWISNHCSDTAVQKEGQQLSWDWYCNQENVISRLLKLVVVGWLPSLLVTLWQGMVLPLVFTYVVQTSRSSKSLSEADRAIAKNMFYFAVFNVFLGGVVGSTIIQGINSAIEKGPSEIFNLIGTYVPTSSNFFINYTLFRAFVALPLRMLWPHIGVRMYLIRRFLRFSCIITKRDKAFLLAPVSPRYGFEVGMVLLTFVIGAAFCVVSPLMVPLAIVFFAMAWLFWRWALLYVYVRKYEGGGTMWPFIFTCMLVCLGIFPTFTACVFVTKHAYIQAILLLLSVPIIITRFNSYCYYRFQTGLEAMPLEATIHAPVARVEPWVYTPPPLLPNLPGWNPDWSKCWQGWNLPVVYG